MNERILSVFVIALMLGFILGSHMPRIQFISSQSYEEPSQSYEEPEDWNHPKIDFFDGSDEWNRSFQDYLTTNNLFSA